MKHNNNVSITGKVIKRDTEGKIALGSYDQPIIENSQIVLNLDYDIDQGLPITHEVYENITSYFIHQNRVEKKDRIGFKFNKQILLMLLSFEKCTSLVFCKCLRPDEKAPDQLIESFAAVAVGADNLPLGYDSQTKKFDPTKFVAFEWIHGLTLEEAQTTLFLENDAMIIDKEKFFNLF